VNTESQVLNVPIEDIIPNRFQPRLNFDETGLKELAASIKEHGIIQPLVLRRLGEKYEIIAGERRYKAAKMANLTSVPAIISMMDDQKSAEVAIVENVQRRDLSSIEEARSYKALLDKGYLTQEELAKKMGLSQSAISNKLRLLSLSSSVQDALMEGKISERHARSLLQVENLEEQEKWLSKIIDERLTVRQLDKKLKELGSNSNNINNISNNDEDISLIEVLPINDEKTENNNIETIENKIQEVPNINNEDDDNLITEIIDTNEESSPTSSIDEEIEMLDFLVPSNEIPEVNIKDMTIATDLIDKLVQDLKNNNYKINLIKDETTNEIKYTISIDKN